MSSEAEKLVADAIENAEELREPAEDLVEKTSSDPTTPDKTIVEESGDEGGGRGLKQADMLIALTHEAELFHTPDGTCFADLHIDGHRESWPIRSNGFKQWLRRLYFEATAS